MKMIQEARTLNTNPVMPAQRSVEFKIGDVGKIIEILRSKIYSNPIQTLVQEYLCNARDAVREVGGGKIIVHLPTDENPVFRVRDFGPGISRDRMLNCFVQYGNTTKDDSNDQNGGFGLGSKLAWAYTDTFTIVTYVNGVCDTYSAHVGKSRNGTLDLVSSRPTKEPNGTEIKVEVKDEHGEFRDAYYRATFLWKNEEMPECYDDGELVEFVENNKISLTETVDLLPVSYQATNMVGDCTSHMALAIDGIPYPLSRDWVRQNPVLSKLDELLCPGSLLVFHVGNGKVEVAASRESISENQRTLSVLAPQAVEAFKAVKEWKKEKLDSKNILEFIENVKFVSDYLSISVETFTDSTKEKFELNINSWGYDDKKILKSDQILKLEILKFQNGDPQRKKRYGGDSIPLGRTTLVYADEKISKAKQTQKMRQYGASYACLLLPGNSSQVYLDSLGERLGAIKLSSIELPKIEREKAEKLADGKVKVQVFKSDYSYGSRKTLVEHVINLNDEKISDWVYMQNSEREDDIKDFKTLEKFLKDCGYGFCIAGARVIEKFKDNKKFVSLEKFLNDPVSVVHKKKYEGLLVDAGAQLLYSAASGLEFFCEKRNEKLLGLIQDKKLRNELKIVAEYRDGSSYSYEVSGFLLNQLVESNPVVAELKKLAESLPAYIAAQYPLVAGSNSFDSDIEPELVHYLNGKFNA